MFREPGRSRGARRQQTYEIAGPFVLDRGKDVPDDDLLHMFLLRYYDATTSCLLYTSRCV